MLVMEAGSELRAEVLAEEIVDRYRSMMCSKVGLLEMIGEFDRRGLAQECGASSTATWLMRRLGISESSAHECAMPGCRPMGLGPRAAKLGIKPLVRCT